ncbi:hypothetical protein [Allorhodopirellula solitaria]|uniref:Secreted protein n=1 Tax=Allorhodopirellula solitaria TaxID=2527987 RepID=A0A5C5XWX2_9BACT|nr:hypothetical protein [Allorhodopirellula solitaria]TWT67374.1 hypothetical protein CA85_22240 [Allorhodopirellula solitaria]
MIVQFLQRLTLIAFTAHAVLGCCWHHGHVLGEDTCHRHTHSVESGQAQHHPSSPHHHDTQCGSGATRSCQHDVTSTDESSQRGETALASTWRDAPCEHTHGCDEGSCHYVPRQADPLTEDFAAHAIDLVPNTGGLLTWTGNRCRWLHPERTDGLPVDSAPQRCIHLQSWQI